MITNGVLDGLTILRYTHAFREGGGVERYLDDLDTLLLLRNNATIIQLSLPKGGSGKGIRVEKIGRGTLIRVPMTAKHDDIVVSVQGDNIYNKIRTGLKDFVRDCILYSCIMPAVFRRIMVRQRFRAHYREPIDAGEKVRYLLEKHKISLIVIHFAGGVGSAQVIEQALHHKIPYLVFNHFSNAWFNRVGIREQVRDAAGVGGVSSVAVPRYVRSVYTSLLDGIDLDFFSKEKVDINIKKEKDGIVILLPSRVTPEKGHLDLLRAVSRLQDMGIILRVVFAGRDDSVEFKRKLIDYIHRFNLEQFVKFTGHLDPKELRVWYALADIVVLPSHSEGLGRVLLESQAMEKPIIAYRVGGIPDAMIDGRTGHLVKRGNITELESALRELILNSEKRTEMGIEGRKYMSEKFSLVALAERHENWYHGALAKPHVVKV